MNIEDKVDIRLTHRIARLTVNVYRMEVNALLNFLVQCKVLHKIRGGKRPIFGINVIIFPLKTQL